MAATAIDRSSPESPDARVTGGARGRLTAAFSLALLAAVVTPSVAQARGGTDAVIGAVVGAGVGALVGQNLGGRDGAIFGSAVGAATGAALASQADSRSHRTYRAGGPVVHVGGYGGGHWHGNPGGYSAPPPRIVQPPVVIYAPPPVYHPPPRVIYRPHPGYVQAVPGWGGRGWNDVQRWDHRGPRLDRGDRRFDRDERRAYRQGYRDGYRQGQRW